MSIEGEVDLNDLIKKDKEQAKMRKFHPIQKEKKNTHPHRQQNQIRNRLNEKPRQKFSEPKKQYSHPGYALLITGFISDVSIDDICNLAQGRKIRSIKTMLRKADKTPIDPKVDIQMQVTINFPEKEDANSFINDYSEKVLDGKYSLTFSFVEPTD